MMNKLVTAIPILLASILGVFFQFAGWNPFVCVLIAVLLIVAGMLARTNARGHMAEDPERAVRVWQWWALAPIGMIALFAYILSSLSAALPHLIEGSGLFDLTIDPTGKTPEQVAAAKAARIATISSMLSVAVSTFLGALFLTDLKGATGGWWPPAQIKQAIGSAFSDLVDQTKTWAMQDGLPTEDREQRLARFETIKRAVQEDSISIKHPSGWSLSAVKARATIIADALKDRPASPS